MRKYLVARALRAALVVWLVTLAVFVALRFSGDPAAAMLPLEATDADRLALRHEMGLERPVYVQYILYMVRLARGDLGSSVRYRQPVLSLIAERLPATVALALSGVSIAIAIGLVLGVLQTVRRGTWFDVVGSMTSVVGFSMPSFWLGMVLIIVFAVRLRWLPSSGMGDWRHLVLPAITLASSLTAYISLVTRDGMIEVLRQDYIRTAHAKGLLGRVVLYKHALRNALVPVVSLIGLQIGHLLGGAVITESVFQWSGLGLLALQAISARDFPVVQGSVLFLAIGVVTMNLAADLAYGVIDPRIRFD